MSVDEPQPETGESIEWRIERQVEHLKEFDQQLAQLDQEIRQTEEKAKDMYKMGPD